MKHHLIEALLLLALGITIMYVGQRMISEGKNLLLG
jgi:hypothetical protein